MNQMPPYSASGFSLGELMFSEKAEVAPRYEELWLTARIDIPAAGLHLKNRASNA